MHLRQSNRREELLLFSTCVFKKKAVLFISPVVVSSRILVFSF